jgi:enoyl-CoA hydratase/carnithine racemase
MNGTAEPVDTPDVVAEMLADSVLQLRIDRPTVKNALRVRTWNELSDAIEAAAADERVRVIVLTDSGNTFCAGFDLGDEAAVARGRYAPSTDAATARAGSTSAASDWASCSR